MQRIEGEFGKGAEGGRDTARKEAERVMVISLSLSKFMNLGRVSQHLHLLSERAFGAVQMSDGWGRMGYNFSSCPAYRKYKEHE